MSEAGAGAGETEEVIKDEYMDYASDEQTVEVEDEADAAASPGMTKQLSEEELQELKKRGEEEEKLRAEQRAAQMEALKVASTGESAEVLF